MSKCWYCNEELTTANYCDEHIGICTKCYGSMFKFSNEFVKGLTDKISDLEAKLEKAELSLGFACKALIDDLNFGNKHEIEHELELHIKHYKSKVEDWLNDYLLLEEQLENANDWRREFQEENQQLKQKLEEKDNTITNLIEDSKASKELLKKQLTDKDKEIENEIKAHHYTIQDMELLEKKHNQDKISFAVEQLEKVKGRVQHNILFESGEDYLNTIEEIDNQLKQLKEGK